MALFKNRRFLIFSCNGKPGFPDPFLGPTPETKEKRLSCDSLFSLVPRLGVEPRLAVPETAVLPLDDLGITLQYYHFCDRDSINVDK